MVAAAQHGDPHSLELLDRLGMLLGVGLAGAINTFEPERIVIGGGLSRAADLFLDRAIAEARSRALPVLQERVTIELARAGADAGVIDLKVSPYEYWLTTSWAPERKLRQRLVEHLGGRTPETMRRAVRMLVEMTDAERDAWRVTLGIDPLERGVDLPRRQLALAGDD